MIEIGAVPDFVCSVSGNPSGSNLYYGLNVSSNIGLEPIDQLDGFLVAYSQKPGRSFYPYIAGVYNILNARSPEEARKTAAKRSKVEQQKKALLENIMKNLMLEGGVLTTYDMWDDQRYWEIVDRLFREGIYDAIPEDQRKRGTPLLNSFPCELLGKMRLGAIPGYIEAGSLYVPAEVAEAVWLREKFGVGWKIGPFSEEIYDGFIAREGIGIIRLRQPKALEDGIEKCVAPYIGKSTQPMRITFSDTTGTLEKKCVADNPSFFEAARLAGALGPLLDSPGVREINNLINLGRDD